MKLTNEQRYLIKAAMKAKDYSMARFCRVAGLDVRQFYTWIYGGTGEKNCMADRYLAAIKKHLGLKL